ncbi:MAG: hypothetical protein KJ622_16770 [Alphaproteobacteria bacterium]|nr:hypothetical protein [Alphaproteobacteria bacterium]
MAGKQDFSPEDWAKLVGSSLFSSVAISAAEPSGLWGTLQEGYANASSIFRDSQNETPLVTEVVATSMTSQGRQLAQDALKTRISGIPREAIVAACVAALDDVSRVLDAKAAEDAAGFKAWLRANAVAVAEAASEGGFLGFGGEKVTEHERATLEQIDAALGLATV